MAADSNQTLRFVLPFSLAMFGRSANQTIAWKVVTDVGTPLFFRSFILSDASPAVADAFFIFPLFAHFITVSISVVGGDTTHFANSSFVIVERTRANLLAQTSFSTDFTLMPHIPSFGSWHQNPNFIEYLTPDAVLNWDDASQTGTVSPAATFPTNISNVNGLTITARWSATADSSLCNTDVIDTDDSAAVRKHRTANSTAESRNGSVERRKMLMLSLCVLLFCFFFLLSCAESPRSVSNWWRSWNVRVGVSRGRIWRHERTLGGDVLSALDHPAPDGARSHDFD
jgi:hypothetical protein